MTPKAATKGRATGTSFKGVFAYLQHDKRQEGHTASNSNERVDWQAFRNLATDDPDMAYRLMRATANQQDALKREAGQSAAGNKSDKVVFHYALGWHPDEKGRLSKSEMLRAADESLRALGAEGHQAAIIAHNDTKHPHVHIVINRVNPENGKMLDLWKYQERLSKWALGYEQERGQIYCENRVENWKRRDLGEKFSAKPDTPYQLNAQTKGIGASNDNDVQRIREAQKAKDADLAARSQKMNLKHTHEWQAYSRDYADGKKAILKRHESPTPFQKAKAEVTESHKGYRSQIAIKQRNETRAFEKREKQLLGKLENAIAAASASKKLGREEGGKPTSLFNFLISSKARRAELDKGHKSEWRNANAIRKADINAATMRIKNEQQSALARHAQIFESRRQLLKDSQDAARATMQRAWQTRKEERIDAFKMAKTAQSTRQEAKAAQEPSRGEQRVKFNKVVRNGRKRKGRSRKRSVDD